jgi:hypothetical protein
MNREQLEAGMDTVRCFQQPLLPCSHRGSIAVVIMIETISFTVFARYTPPPGWPGDASTNPVLSSTGAAQLDVSGLGMPVAVVWPTS